MVTAVKGVGMYRNVRSILAKRQRGSFIRGLGSVLEVMGPREYLKPSYSSLSDYRSIRNDWITVGNHMRIVMEGMSISHSASIHPDSPGSENDELL